MSGVRSWLLYGVMAMMSLAVVAGVTLGIEYGARHSFLFWVEHWTSDWRSTFLSHRPNGQHQNVAVIKVNEDTIGQYPYRTPIDRGLVARLVTALDSAGAEAIAIDFLFLKTTEPAKEEALISAIKAAKARVVVAVGDSRAELNEAQKAYQADFLKRSGAVPGFANLLTGSDRIVRFIAPPADPGFPKSFGAAAANPSAEKMVDGPRRIAWLLRPRDGNERFLELPAHLLASPADRPAPPTAKALAPLLKGRVVFIGADLIGIDRHLTPLASWEGDDEMAGVMLHAQVAAQVLDGRSISRVGPDILRVVYALVAAFGVWTGLRYGVGAYSLYFGTATLAIAAIDVGLFIFASKFLPFGACMAALVGGLIGGILLRRLARLMNALLRIA